MEIDEHRGKHMRKVEFSELKLKDTSSEELFYQKYLKNLQDRIKESDEIQEPTKQYEIFDLNIFEGKIILLNKDYIVSQNESEALLFYDYEHALKVYKLLLDIEDGINDEQNEFNELYKEERLQKDKEIERIKEQDEKLYEEKKVEYNNVINSRLYKDWDNLREENERLRLENKRLKEEIDELKHKNNNIFLRKLINMLKNKRLPKC